MMAKVQWYEEVLAIDPTSKVFLPYARDLLGSGDVGKAISVLRRGLTHCPDCEEARVLLVHALYVSGRDREAVTEARCFVDWADTYPGFWSAVLEAKSEMCPDASLYLRLAEGVIKGRACTLADVFKHGIDAVLGVELMHVSTVDAQACPRHEALDETPDKSPKGIPSVDTVDTLDGTVDRRDGQPDVETCDDADEDDRPLTLRTRSMAALLAEQGDVRGALDIYGEILLEQPDDEELARTVERLTEQLNAPAGMPFQPTSQNIVDVLENVRSDDAVGVGDVHDKEDPIGGLSDADDGQSNVKILLASLADRLDARARNEG